MRTSILQHLSRWGKRSSLSAVAAGFLFVGGAAGSEPSFNGSDALFQQIGLRLEQELASDMIEPPPPQVEFPPPEAPPPEEEKPWTLIGLYTDACGKNFWADNGQVFGGWTQFGYQNNPDGAFTGNGAFVNQREWDRLNLNQQYLFLGRVADGQKGLDLGFRIDLMYGVDGNEAQSFGNNPGRFDYLNGWDHGIYEWALPQAYGEVAFGDLSLKIGHFYTPVGYEVIPSNGNFFLSRQLTFYNSEPFTHTGVLGTYKANDKLQIVGGWVLGMDTGFDQFNQSNAVIGGFIYQATDKLNLTYMMTGGNLGWRGDGSINSLILTYAWTEKLVTVHQFDVLNSNLVNANGVKTDFATDGVAGDSIGQINYAFYQINDKVRAGIREEWYKADGISYYTLTYGVNIFPCKNLVVRPEVRHMWSPGNDLVYGAANGFNESLFNQTVFGIDMILTY